MVYERENLSMDVLSVTRYLDKDLEGDLEIELGFEEMGRKLNLSHLSEEECKQILEVIQRDFKLRQSEEERLNKIQQDINQEHTKGIILSKKKTFNENYCIRCYSTFFFIFNRRVQCILCGYNVCKDCAECSEKTKKWTCTTCLTERDMKAQSCEWFYKQIKSRFRRFGSAKVVRSLYKRKVESESDHSNSDSGYDHTNSSPMSSMYGSNVMLPREQVPTKDSATNTTAEDIGEAIAKFSIGIQVPKDAVREVEGLVLDATDGSGRSHSRRRGKHHRRKHFSRDPDNGIVGSIPSPIEEQITPPIETLPKLEESETKTAPPDLIIGEENKASVLESPKKVRFSETPTYVEPSSPEDGGQLSPIREDTVMSGAPPPDSAAVDQGVGTSEDDRFMHGLKSGREAWPRDALDGGEDKSLVNSDLGTADSMVQENIPVVEEVVSYTAQEDVNTAISTDFLSEGGEQEPDFETDLGLQTLKSKSDSLDSATSVETHFPSESSQSNISSPATPPPSMASNASEGSNDFNTSDDLEPELENLQMSASASSETLKSEGYFTPTGGIQSPEFIDKLQKYSQENSDDYSKSDWDRRSAAASEHSTDSNLEYLSPLSEPEQFGITSDKERETEASVVEEELSKSEQLLEEINEDTLAEEKEAIDRVVREVIESLVNYVIAMCDRLDEVAKETDTKEMIQAIAEKTAEKSILPEQEATVMFLPEFDEKHFAVDEDEEGVYSLVKEEERESVQERDLPDVVQDGRYIQQDGDDAHIYSDSDDDAPCAEVDSHGKYVLDADVVQDQRYQDERYHILSDSDAEPDAGGQQNGYIQDGDIVYDSRYPDERYHILSDSDVEPEDVVPSGELRDSDSDIEEDVVPSIHQDTLSSQPPPLPGTLPPVKDVRSHDLDSDDNELVEHYEISLESTVDNEPVMHLDIHDRRQQFIAVYSDDDSATEDLVPPSYESAVTGQHLKDISDIVIEVSDEDIEDNIDGVPTIEITEPSLSPDVRKSPPAVEALTKVFVVETEHAYTDDLETKNIKSESRDDAESGADSDSSISRSPTIEILELEQRASGSSRPSSDAEGLSNPASLEASAEFEGPEDVAFEGHMHRSPSDDTNGNYMDSMPVVVVQEPSPTEYELDISHEIAPSEDSVIEEPENSYQQVEVEGEENEEVVSFTGTEEEIVDKKEEVEDLRVSSSDMQEAIPSEHVDDVSSMHPQVKEVLIMQAPPPVSESAPETDYTANDEDPSPSPVMEGEMIIVAATPVIVESVPMTDYSVNEEDPSQSPVIEDIMVNPVETSDIVESAPMTDYSINEEDPSQSPVVEENMVIPMETSGIVESAPMIDYDINEEDPSQSPVIEEVMVIPVETSGIVESAPMTDYSINEEDPSQSPVVEEDMVIPVETSGIVESAPVTDYAINDEELAASPDIEEVMVIPVETSGIVESTPMIDNAINEEDPSQSPVVEEVMVIPVETSGIVESAPVINYAINDEELAASPDIGEVVVIPVETSGIVESAPVIDYAINDDELAASPDIENDSTTDANDENDLKIEIHERRQPIESNISVTALTRETLRQHSEHSIDGYTTLEHERVGNGIDGHFRVDRLTSLRGQHDDLGADSDSRSGGGIKDMERPHRPTPPPSPKASPKKKESLEIDNLTKKMSLKQGEVLESAEDVLTSATQMRELHDQVEELEAVISRLEKQVVMDEPSQESGTSDTEMAAAPPVELKQGQQLVVAEVNFQPEDRPVTDEVKKPQEQLVEDVQALEEELLEATVDNTETEKSAASAVRMITDTALKVISSTEKFISDEQGAAGSNSDNDDGEPLTRLHISEEEEEPREEKQHWLDIKLEVMEPDITVEPLERSSSTRSSGSKVHDEVAAIEERVYMSAGKVFSLEDKVKQLENQVEDINENSPEQQLLDLEDKVALAIAQVAQSERQVLSVEARIAALNQASRGSIGGAKKYSAQYSLDSSLPIRAEASPVLPPRRIQSEKIPEQPLEERITVQKRPATLHVHPKHKKEESSSKKKGFLKRLTSPLKSRASSSTEEHGAAGGSDSKQSKKSQKTEGGEVKKSKHRRRGSVKGIAAMFEKRSSKDTSDKSTGKSGSASGQSVREPSGDSRSEQPGERSFKGSSSRTQYYLDKKPNRVQIVTTLR
ncbi:uncharacterized protein LOC144450559 [Glandiceps talaboti]